jgi:hypothetical protein
VEDIVATIAKQVLAITGTSNEEIVAIATSQDLIGPIPGGDRVTPTGTTAQRGCSVAEEEGVVAAASGE